MDQGNTSTNETNTIIISRQCFTFQGHLQWRSWLINLMVV